MTRLERQVCARRPDFGRCAAVPAECACSIQRRSEHAAHARLRINVPITSAAMDTVTSTVGDRAGA